MNRTTDNEPPPPGPGAQSSAGSGEADPLLAFRPEFPLLGTCIYMVSHSLGAMPRGAAEGLAAYAGEWNTRGVRAWAEGWWELPVRVGDQVARLLGAPAGSISMQPNVTLATALFLSACSFAGTRRRLVTDALNFPSLLYLFDGLGAGTDSGIEVVTVPSEDGMTIDPERFREAIDERTAVVALSHVLFRSSFVQDLEAIVGRAREAGAWVLLDLYQSAGIVPIDLSALGVEAAVGGCLKWLCGGPGNAFLYVRPDLDLRPRLTGWMAHADPFAFAGPPMERAGGAWRFLHGTPAIPALRAASAGLDLVAEAGIERVRAKSLRQTALLLERADREGWTVRTPRASGSRGGVVSIEPPHAYEVSRALLARDIVIDYRPGGGIRFGPHLYNTDEEIVRALDTVGEILRSEEWKRFEGRARDRVT